MSAPADREELARLEAELARVTAAHRAQVDAMVEAQEVLASERSRFAELQQLLGRAVNERDASRENHAEGWKLAQEMAKERDAALASVAALREALETAFAELDNAEPGSAIHTIQNALAAPDPGAGWVSPEEHAAVKRRAQEIYGEALFDNAALTAEVEKLVADHALLLAAVAKALDVLRRVDPVLSAHGVDPHHILRPDLRKALAALEAVKP